MIFDMDPKFACQLKINQKSFHFRRIPADIFSDPKTGWSNSKPVFLPTVWTVKDWAFRGRDLWHLYKTTSFYFLHK